MTGHEEVKALLFDVFGTVVDWRNSVTDILNKAADNAVTGPGKASSATPTAEACERAAEMGRDKWLDFTVAWRQSYYAFTRGLAADPTKAYKTIEQHFHDSLVQLLEQWGLQGLWSPEEVKELSGAWSQLKPWADTVRGLQLLNRKVKTVTLSNGSVKLLSDMAEYANLPWTHVYSSELFKSYKPNPVVYLGAVEKLGLQPHQCAMVASHLNDLRAAKDQGLFTIYTERPHEEAWDAAKIDETRRAGWVDIWVDIDGDATQNQKGAFVEVAKRLGIEDKV